MFLTELSYFIITGLIFGEQIAFFVNIFVLHMQLWFFIGCWREESYLQAFC